MKKIMGTAFAMLLDSVCFNIGVIAALYIRYLGSPPQDMVETLRYVFFEFEEIFPLHIHLMLWMPALIFLITGVYNRSITKSPGDVLAGMVFFSSAISVLVLFGFLYLNRAKPDIEQLPFLVPLLAMVLSPCLSLGWRYTLRRMVAVQERAWDTHVNLLVVGLSGFDEDTYRRITENDFPKYNLVGYLEGKERESFVFEGSASRLGRLGDLLQHIRNELVEEVLIMPSAITESEFLEVVKTCDVEGVDYRIVPSYFDMVASRSEISLVNFVPLIHFGHPTIRGWNYFFKRLLDYSLGIFMLVLFSPMLILVALLIKLDSSGPIFFKQDRVGRNGRKFKVFKFRTMRQGSEKGNPLTVENDPRITKFGAFLRRYSIDEAPQVFNVLRGEMSLVGPRAVVPYVADEFNDLERMTLNVLPGITGLAQVSGRDAISFRDKSMLNIYYIRNYSIWLDFKILLKTVTVSFTGEGNL